MAVIRIPLNEEIKSWFVETSNFATRKINEADETDTIEFQLVEGINIPAIWKGFRCRSYDMYINNERISRQYIPDALGRQKGDMITIFYTVDSEDQG